MCLIISYLQGGGIGDSLFFFVSGFTLFLGGNYRFDNWYKRRIGRIYPTVLAAGIISAWLLSNEGSFLYIALFQRYWFLQCIFLYYIVLYPIKYFNINAKLSLYVSMAIVVFIYFAFYDFSNRGLIFGVNYFRWYMFFLFMLFGAILGKQSSNGLIGRYCWYDLPMLLLCTIAWYAMAVVIGKNWFQILMLLPTFGICYYLYKVGCSPFITKLLSIKFSKAIICGIASMCLECYLIQFYVITDKLNFMFPFNIPVIFVMIFFAAFIVKMFAEFIRQTIGSGSYEWKKFYPQNILNIK